MPRVTVCAALFAGILLVLLSACQSPATRPIIKIGLTAPFTGFDESVGYSVIGAVRLAIRERNLAGGVAGYSVELVALDDANQPEVAAQRAREMIVDPAAMAVLGGFDEDAALAAAAEYKQAGMAFVSFVGSERLANSTVFRLTATHGEAGRYAAEFATGQLAARRIAVVGERAPGQDELGDTFVATAREQGASIVYRGQIARWQLDFATTVAALAAAQPDLVFFAGRAAEGGELLRQMRAAGLTAMFLGGPATDDRRLLQIAGQAAEGAYYVSAGFGLESVADADLRRRLTESALRPTGPYTVLAYDGTRLLLDALARAITAEGKPTRAGVAEAVRVTAHQGVGGHSAFDGRGRRREILLSSCHIKTDAPFAGCVR